MSVAQLFNYSLHLRVTDGSTIEQYCDEQVGAK